MVAVVNCNPKTNADYPKTAQTISREQNVSEMAKVVINCCYGGFGLSKKAEKYLESKGIDVNTLERHNPILIQCIEELGEEADGAFAKLVIVNVQNHYKIDEYHGFEGITTPEDTDWIEANPVKEIYSDEDFDRDKFWAEVLG